MILISIKEKLNKVPHDLFKCYFKFFDYAINYNSVEYISKFVFSNNFKIL